MFYVDEEEKIGCGEFFIKSPETDCFYKARPSYYFGLNQEMGGLHATAKGVGLKKLYDEEQKTWMIIRTRMHIDKLMNWADIIRLETWCQDGYRLYCPRAVRAYDKADGSPVFQADNWWVIMDLARKRPCRPDIIKDVLPESDPDKRHFDPAFPAFAKAEDYSEEMLQDWPIEVTYYDTDYNRHVNNISYVNWIMEALPKEFLDSYMPSFFDVKWEKQCFLTDELYVRTSLKNSLESSKPEIFSKIIRRNGSDEETVFEAATEWRKRD